MLSLAKSILERDFGSITGKVASLLLDHGKLSLGSLIQKSGLSPRQTKESLFILMHHSIVLWEENCYFIQVEMAIARIMAPKIILHARRLHSNECGEAVKFLFLNGAVSVDWFRGKEDILKWLKENKFILFVQNFSSPTSFAISSSLVKISSLEPQNSSTSSLPGQEKKRKLNAISPDLLGEGESAKKQQKIENESTGFVRLNYTAFVRLQRHQFLLDYIQRKYNESARIVLEVIFEHLNSSESSGSVSTFQLNQTLKNDGKQLTPFQDSNAPALPNYIELLMEDCCKVVVATKGMEKGAISIDERALDSFFQLRMIQSVAHARFGQEALRIVNLLQSTGNALDDKLICKHALLPIRQTREILINLMRYGIVASQEVPKTSDHMPSRTFYLWKFDLEKASCAIQQRICQALGNLNARIGLEYSNNALLIAKTMRKDVQQNFELLSGGEREALQRLYQTLNQLEHSLMENAVSLFCLNKFA